MYYILKGKIPIPENDLIKWGTWFESADRTVAKIQVTDEIDVSTVFLGLDHNWGDGPPILFETMVFGGELDEEGARYATWDEAEKGHDRIVKLVRLAEGLEDEGLMR